MSSRDLAFRVRQDFGQVDGRHAGTLAMQPSTDMHQTGRI